MRTALIAAAVATIAAGAISAAHAASADEGHKQITHSISRVLRPADLDG